MRVSTRTASIAAVLVSTSVVLISATRIWGKEPTGKAFGNQIRADADLNPEAAHWDTDLGEFILEWEDIRSDQDPHALALEFAHSAFGHACHVCEWDPVLAGSAQGNPPPIH